MVKLKNGFLKFLIYYSNKISLAQTLTMMIKLIKHYHLSQWQIRIKFINNIIKL